MATTAAKKTSYTEQAGNRPSENLLGRLLKYLGLMILDAFALLLAYSFAFDGNLGLAIVIGVITLFVNVVVLVPNLYPVRWMSPGLALSMLLVIYPILFTVQTAFTNYSDGNLLPKEQAIRLIQNQDRSYVAPNAAVYEWEVFQNASGTYALWLTRENDGAVETLFAPAGEAVQTVTETFAEIPAEYQGYALLDRAGRTRALSVLQETAFGEGEDTVGIVGRREAARPLVSRYAYDPNTDTITDRESGAVFVANEQTGFFEQQGNPSNFLSPGYRVFVGVENFDRLVNDPALSGPLVSIFIWTVMFAFASVVTTFAMGLLMALILNDPIIPGRKIIRSILLIPYAIPGVISILIWRGMMNQNLGIINDFLGQDIPWLNDALWSKIAIILVNLWLGYPYMMLVCSGALQAIPSEVYEAAAVDGANPWQRFWNITLPLLLVAVGPLLIGSFTFNFNNYMLITALTGGNPPIQAPIPAGQTDILISYVYKAAFSNQADYGYASAITIVIFVIVASVTLLQYRFTRTWEQVGENV